MPRARACPSRFLQAAIVRRREHRGCRLPRIVRRHERDSIGASAAEPTRGSVGGDRRCPSPRFAAVTLGGTTRLGHPTIGSFRGRGRLLAQCGEHFLPPGSRHASDHGPGDRAQFGAALLLARLHRRVLRRTGGMLAMKDTKNEAALLEVSQDIAVILVEGIRAASVVPTFFSQVAATMLGVAATQFSAQGYEVPLRSGFVRHGIWAPSLALAATHA